MPSISRFANAVWQLFIPFKHDKSTAPSSKKQHIITPLHIKQESSLSNLSIRRSMSYASRVDSWRVINPESSRKRKHSSSDPERSSKRERLSPRDVLPSIETNMDDIAMSGVDIDVDGSADITTRLSDVHVTPHRQNKSHIDRFSSPLHISLSDNSNSTSPTSSPKTKPQEDTTTQLPPSDLLTTYPQSIQPLISSLLSRGRVPILPSHWSLDFKFLPSSLFESCSSTQAVLSPFTTSNDFRAQKAFNSVLELGSRVKDLVLMNKAPEGIIKKTIDGYMNFVMRDANVEFLQNKQQDESEEVEMMSGKIPNITTIVTGDKSVDPAELQVKLARKMSDLLDLWDKYSSISGLEIDRPTIYGVVVSHSLMAFVTFTPTSILSSQMEKVDVIMSEMKTVGMFDLGVEGLDVWNALAVVLLAVHVRDVLMRYN